MFDPQILTFIGVALVLTLTPGADTMLVMRNVLARGSRAGIMTTLGICSGLFVHATLSALGLSFILVRSATAFEVVKFVGACYLIFLGLRSLWQLLRTRHTRAGEAVIDEQPAGQQKAGALRSFREGLLTNILNPKVAIFYLAFLPQFMHKGDPVLAKSLLLAAIHFTLGVLWLSLVALFLGRVRVFMTRPSVRRTLEAVTGTVLIAFGIRLALTQR
ncbi:MAG TPA: LysE family translocator [Ktedonobacteraceae bacterium]|nr:LysE family translocator [Ktedonobacteraceae bacterium]